MTQTVEQRRTIEARLDRLKKRLDRIAGPQHLSPTSDSTVIAVLKGTLDLLTDVLLEDEPRPAPVHPDVPPYGKDY